VYLALCIWGSIESVCGLMQILGLRSSRHALFHLTGHFDNPGPFGGFVAVIGAMAACYIIRYRYRYKGLYRSIMMVVSIITLFCCLLVLPASLSRAAWLAFVFAILVGLLNDESIRKRMKANRVTIFYLGLIFVLFCAGAVALKPESAIGRPHIWNIDMRTIASSPLCGVGRSNMMGAYGKAQEAFFRRYDGDISATITHVAGCPEYPFNEYLGAGMAFGVPVMIVCIGLTITITILLWRRKSFFAAGIFALAVFAVFSYPMSIVQFRMLLSIMLFGACFELSFHSLWRFVGAVSIVIIFSATLLIPLFSEKSDDYKELYRKGYSLHCEGRYLESSSFLKRGAEMSSDPMFHVIIGKNAEYMGEFQTAENEYLKAHYMVPCRIYPLVRLMKLYLRQGQNEKAVAMAEKIQTMPVNKKNKVMVKLHGETLKSLDSLKAGGCTKEH